MLRTSAAETKVLKQLLRDHIDPKRDLGHSDRHGKGKKQEDEGGKKNVISTMQEEMKDPVAPAVDARKDPTSTICEDCG
jgi:hypothetical protein